MCFDQSLKGCVSTNPKSSSFAFPLRLRDAIVRTQRNARFEVDEDTPSGPWRSCRFSSPSTFAFIGPWRSCSILFVELVALQRPPQYACGCLFLLSEVLKEKPTLWRVVLQNESVDDEIEHFEDIVEEDQEIPSEMNSKLTSFPAQNGKLLDFMVSTEDSNSDKENKLNDDPRAERSGGDTGMKSQIFSRRIFITPRL